MIILEFPWALLFLPAPLIARRLLPPYHSPQASLVVPFFEALASVDGAQRAPILRRDFAQKFMLICIWLLVIVAMTKPVWLSEPIVKMIPARDLMIAVDLSASMETEDFSPISTDSSEYAPTIASRISRLDGVKQVLLDFISNRTGDRLGLIVFGSAPFLQVPFTQDRELFEFLLLESQPRMAGPKTLIGDAIGLAIRHFNTPSSGTTQDIDRFKTLIIVSDGNDSGSQIPPIEAAAIAKDNGITIYTIGIGSEESDGNETRDWESLKEIAVQTGGQFFSAQDEKGLRSIYLELNKLAPSDVKSITYIPVIQIYHLPLSAATIVALIFYFILTLRKFSAKTLPTQSKHPKVSDHIEMDNF